MLQVIVHNVWVGYEATYDFVKMVCDAAAGRPQSWWYRGPGGYRRPTGYLCVGPRQMGFVPAHLPYRAVGSGRVGAQAKSKTGLGVISGC